MKRLYLIRHGETALNRDKVFRGRLDTPLNETGRREARAVGAALRDKPIAAIYASPLSRAIETVTPLAEARGLEIKRHAGLIDIDFGRWQGAPLERIRREEPELYELWEKTPQLARFPGGETIAEVRQRALRVVAEMRDAHPGAEVALCSHRVPLKMLVIGLTGRDDADFWLVYLETASITAFDFDSAGPHPVCQNDIAHLADLAADRLHTDF